MSDCGHKDCKDFTYSGDLTNPLDYVRFIVGDTNPSHPMLDNQEIESALSLKADDPTQASILILSGLIARYSHLSDVKVGPVSKSFKGIAAVLQKRLDELEKDACLIAIPSFPAMNDGCYSAGDKCCPSKKTGAAFQVGMFDNDDHHTTQLTTHLGYLARYGF